MQTALLCLSPLPPACHQRSSWLWVAKKQQKGLQLLRSRAAAGPAQLPSVLQQQQQQQEQQ
jgi:hypothetical protein